MPVLREAEHEPLRGAVKTLTRESFAAYLRTISSVLSRDSSRPMMHSHSAKGWLNIESRLSPTYCSTSQHGMMIEKKGFIRGIIPFFHATLRMKMI